MTRVIYPNWKQFGQPIMPKNKIGEIQKIGVDAEGLEIFRVRVEVGTREKALREKGHDSRIMTRLSSEISVAKREVG